MGEGPAHGTTQQAKPREGAADQLQIQHGPVQTLVETLNMQGGLSGKAPVIFVKQPTPCKTA